MKLQGMVRRGPALLRHQAVLLAPLAIETFQELSQLDRNAVEATRMGLSVHRSDPR